MQIDVIIPVYNRAHLLARAITSVLEQSYRDFHLTIVDDGSTDDIASVIEQYTSQRNVSFIRQENSGVSAARNAGILSTKNSWIALLDSDDEWLPHKLERQVKYIFENPECTFLHSDEIWVRNGVRVNPKQKFYKGHEDLFRRSLEMCLISPSTVLMHRSAAEKHGYFNEEFPVCEDYDLWLKILLREKIGFIPEHLIIKNGGHEDQLSTKFPAMDFWRIRSMLHLLKTQVLRIEQMEMITAEILKKAPVLLNGYLKHGNLAAHDELVMQLEQAGLKII